MVEESFQEAHMKFYNHSIPIVPGGQLCNRKASCIMVLHQHNDCGLTSVDDILVYGDNLQVYEMNLNFHLPVSHL